MLIDNRESGLTTYLGEISRIPLLSPSEEIRLARLAIKGDASARRHLIVSNLRLVVSIAKKYIYYGLPLQDLIEEGNIGLMKAADKFDPDRGWVADAVLLIQAVDHFNWPRFVSLAKDRRLTAPAGALLVYLQGQMAMEMPATVLAELAAATGSDDIQRLTMRSRPDVSGGGEELLYLLRRWRRLRQDQNLRGKVPGLMRFLCHILGIPSRRELLHYGFGEFLRRRT